jgi:hypothetical protein
VTGALFCEVGGRIRPSGQGDLGREQRQHVPAPEINGPASWPMRSASAVMISGIEDDDQGGGRQVIA